MQCIYLVSLRFGRLLNGKLNTFIGEVNRLRNDLENVIYGSMYYVITTLLVKIKQLKSSFNTPFGILNILETLTNSDIWQYLVGSYSIVNAYFKSCIELVHVLSWQE